MREGGILGLQEGLHPFVLGPGKEAPPAEFRPLDPIFEYPRTIGLSITSGNDTESILPLRRCR